MELIFRIGNFFLLYLDVVLWPLYYFYSLVPMKKLPRMIDAEILTQSATSLARKIRHKEYTCEQVMSAYIQRCQAVNPIVNGIVDNRYVDAMIEAQRMDSILRTTQKTIEQIEAETPFLGVPFTVKESCSVQGLSFSIGSKSRIGIRAERDGAAVLNLRKAGGIPIAVTNTPELCASYETSNEITGFTFNPYDLHRTTSGSSGGEVALIASAGSVIGIASDFGGSIRIPCSFTGIFGHKPSPEIVPCDGHFPYLSNSEFLHYFAVGPICRYAEDLKPMLKVLAAENAHKLNLDKPLYIRDVKVYFIEQATSSIAFPSVDKDIKMAIRSAASYLYKHHGCSTQKVYFEELKESFEMCVSIFARIDGIKASLQYVNRSTSTLLDVGKAFFKMSEYTIDYAIFRFLIEAKGFVSEKRKKMYIQMRDTLNKKMLNVLKDDGILLYPTFAGPAFYRQQQLCKMSGCIYSVIFNLLGYPATHVPVGLNKKNLPIGFQVVAAPNQDRLCLAVAQQLEIAFGGWVPPPSN